MHNVFQEQVHAGLKLLADNRGKNGIPEGPDPGARDVPEGRAAADLLAEKQLLKQQQDADQAETEIQRDAEPGS